MTVAELIEKLQSMPPNAVVLVNEDGLFRDPDEVWQGGCEPSQHERPFPHYEVYPERGTRLCVVID